MKQYLKCEYKAIIIGIVGYWIFFAANELYGNMLLKTGIITIEYLGSAHTKSWNWHPTLIISTILISLVTVAPGYLSGWFSMKQGTLNGMVVVLLCYSVKTFIFSINFSTFTFGFFNILGLFQALITPVMIGAVSGAAGQFHRKFKN